MSDSEEVEQYDYEAEEIGRIVRELRDAISLRRMADIRQCIKTLKAKNADLVKLSRENLWILEAVKTGIPEIVEYIIDLGADLSVEVNGMNAVFSAHEYSGIVKILIANKLNINGQDTEYGNTPLCYSILRKNIKTALALIEAGADVNKANFDSNTPILLAAGTDRFVSLR
jgi:ankyrin repeat protein